HSRGGASQYRPSQRHGTGSGSGS
nr:Chain P, Myelin Basic Protein peptide with 8 residue linker peptide [synthetic construct]